jgi:hypothetical protein
VIDLGKIIIPRLRVYNIPATLSLGMIILPKSITDVYNIPATLSPGLIILPKSITDVLNIPATLSLGMTKSSWCIVDTSD